MVACSLQGMGPDRPGRVPGADAAQRRAASPDRRSRHDRGDALGVSLRAAVCRDLAHRRLGRVCRTRRLAAINAAFPVWIRRGREPACRNRAAAAQHGGAQLRHRRRQRRRRVAVVAGGRPFAFLNRARLGVAFRNRCPRGRAPRSAWWRRSAIAARRSLATPSIILRRVFRERLGGAELEG